MNICFISDFYADEIIGGAELCNDALIINLEENVHLDQMNEFQY